MLSDKVRYNSDCLIAKSDITFDSDYVMANSDIVTVKIQEFFYERLLIPDTFLMDARYRLNLVCCDFYLVFSSLIPPLYLSSCFTCSQVLSFLQSLNSGKLL